MSDVFFTELELPEPAYRLDLHTADPDAMRPGIVAALERERPDWLLVYGDTNSTLAGAEAAIAVGVPVAHVEAGLRSGDLSMPEERNRIAVDKVAELLLPPDERSAETLRAEGVGGRIDVVGDVMADACFRFAPIARERSRHPRAARARARRLRRGDDPPRGERTAGAAGADRRRPRTDRRAGRLPRPSAHAVAPAASLRANVRLVEPLGYLDMAALSSQARVIVTDSGGLQKEAYWYGVPCVTARPSTEWIDTVEVGANVLVDDDPERLAAAVSSARMPEELPPLYGDGHASERVSVALRG